MSVFRQTCNMSAATAAALLGLPVAAALAQQVNGSEGGNAAMREKLILSEATIKGLTESLAVANGETELFQRKFNDLNSRVEALGISPSGKEEEALQTRLLAAVRDLRLLQNENDATREHLVGLVEAVMNVLKTSDSIDPKARLKVEEELRSIATLTTANHNASSANAISLTSGTIVDYKPDLSLAVANFGSRQGAKTGMPFQVWRGNNQIAAARIVDVRDSISGAVIQDTESATDSVRAGDTLRIDTTR
jgi:hypothetical protein